MFCYLFFYTGRQTFGFAIPGIEEELGLTKTTLGLISGIALWSYAVGQLVNGNLADKFGGRRMMTGGAILSTILNWATSFAGGAFSLGAAWGANNFAQAMGWAPGGRVISNWWAPHERGKSFGFYTLAAGCASVLAFVTSILVVEVFELDWRWIFRIPVILMLVGGITFYLAARDTPADYGVKPPRKFTEDEEHTSGQLDGSESESGTSWQRYKAVLKTPKIWSTGISIGFQNTARYGLLIWVPVYFLGGDFKSGSSVIDPIWISLALPVGMAVGAFTNGQLSDRLFGSRRDKPIIIFMLLGAVAVMVMYLVPMGALMGIVVLFIAGFLVYGPAASFWALCPDIMGKKMAGTATGVVNFFSYLFAGLGEPIIGGIMESTGETSVIFPIVAVACVLSATAATTIRR
ncbi:glycerol-3-phosphate transporter [Arthrobacter tecti]